MLRIFSEEDMETDRKGLQSEEILVLLLMTLVRELYPWCDKRLDVWNKTRAMKKEVTEKSQGSRVGPRV